MTARLLLLAAVAALGCGPAGPGRYPVTGTVTLAGKPVPAGEVTFEPDAAAGNTGPGSFARIANGRYATEPGMGVVGGKYVARVTPFDGIPTVHSSDGTPLVREPHVERLDLPAEPSTRDFDIPAPGRKK